MAAAESGVITTVAGNGTAGYSGDGGPATSAEIDSPYGLAVDAFGNLYVSDYANNVIRKVDKGGTITTVAGNGTSGYGGGVTSRPIPYNSGIAVDASGNLYFADMQNNRILKDAAPIPPAPSYDIVFAVGQNSFTAYGRSIAMDASPFISNGRTFMPVAYLADALGADTVWQPNRGGCCHHQGDEH
jgi:hypothetical protein